MSIDRLGKKYDLTLIHGNHGYDNHDDSMKGIFYASGPEFQRNFTLDRSTSLYNVDLFNLMCYILQIQDCPSSNGTISHIEPLVVNARRMRRFLQSNRQPTVERVLFLFGKFHRIRFEKQNFRFSIGRSRFDRCFGDSLGFDFISIRIDQSSEK